MDTPTKEWKKLKEYRCPMPGCGSPLREFNHTKLSEYSIHVCTICSFQISDRKLSQIAVIRHRKLEPPDFIQELRNQEQLNNL